jgi:hypothetical protein
MPTIELSPVTNGDTVGLYSDASCSTLIESVSVTTDPQPVTLSSPLADGSYSFYAKATNTGNASVCSIASLAYEVSASQPVAATNLVFEVVEKTKLVAATGCEALTS